MPKLIDPTRLDNGMKAWLVYYARKNLWRVPDWYDLSDLIQDGYICYLKCRARYKGSPRITQRREFMALFMRAFINHVTDLSNLKTDAGEVPILSGVDSLSESQAIERFVPPEHEEATTRLLIKEAPLEVKALMYLFFTEDGRGRLQRRLFRRCNGERETTNEFLCRLIGVDPDTVNLPNIVQNYLLN